MRGRPFGARRHRPNLLGTAVGTVVIAGTASAVTGVVRRRHHNGRNHVEAEATPPPPAISEDELTLLERLAELRKSGVLSEEELAAEKAKILVRPA